MIVVCDASPLITLSRIGALHIIPGLFGEIVIATEVFREVTVAGALRAGAHEVQSAEWIRTKDHSNVAQFQEWKTQRRLGSGETATILLARELSADLASFTSTAAAQASNHVS